MNRILYVIAPLSNPVRYRSRYRLFEAFRDRIAACPHVKLIIAEQSFGDRPFQLTERANPYHVQVRAGPESELWIKESLINIGFRHLTGLDPDWKYACWADADIEWLRPDWALETIEALQHFRVVQPWSIAIDLDPLGQPFKTHESFAATYWHNQSAQPNGYHGRRRLDGVNLLHPGFAWAIRRETYDAIGGLLDWLPMGSGDFFMAHAFIDNLPAALKTKVGTDAYRRRLLAWGARVSANVHCDLGFVPGTIHHHWHGKKRERFYIERDRLLASTGFNPDRDLTYNSQGLLVLTGANRKLRDTLRRYLRSRNEDSIDLD